MPCNCDHMKPDEKETESVTVMGFLKDLGLYSGEIGYYGNVEELNNHVKMLCDFCQSNDVLKQSLELQLWWVKHMISDRDRLERERSEKARKELALAQIPDDIKKILGL